MFSVALVMLAPRFGILNANQLLNPSPAKLPAKSLAIVEGSVLLKPEMLPNWPSPVAEIVSARRLLAQAIVRNKTAPMNSNFLIALPIPRNEHVWFRNVNRHIWFKTLPLQKRLKRAVGILLKFI